MPSWLAQVSPKESTPPTLNQSRCCGCGPLRDRNSLPCLRRRSETRLDVFGTRNRACLVLGLAMGLVMLIAFFLMSWHKKVTHGEHCHVQYHCSRQTAVRLSNCQNSYCSNFQSANIRNVQSVKLFMLGRRQAANCSVSNFLYLPNRSLTPSNSQTLHPSNSRRSRTPNSTLGFRA